MHIAHVFLHSRGSKAERMHHALVEIGPSIFNGGATSVIGVVVFAGMPSASMRLPRVSSCGATPSRACEPASAQRRRKQCRRSRSWVQHHIEIHEGIPVVAGVSPEEPGTNAPQHPHLAGFHW